MSPQAKTRLEKVALWVLSTIGTIGIGAILILLMSVRDTQKYIQPQVDKEQNEAISANNRYTKMVDSTIAEKNANLYKYVDNTKDDLKDDIQNIKDNVEFIKDFIVGKKKLTEN